MNSNRSEINDEIYITKQITTDDIPSLIKYLNNPKIYANTLAIPYPYTQKDGEAYINNVQSSSSESAQTFIIRLNDSNELIGECGLHRSPTNERRASIGYWLAEPYWNRGLMPKVVSEVIEIGKIQWKNLVRIEAHTYTWNLGSIRVVEKCGFLFEGVLRKHDYKDGQDLDINSYGLIFE